MDRLKEYYRLTKPGIVRGNALSLIAGALLASSIFGFDLMAICSVLIGSSLIIASGCVFNNYIDRGIDAKMKRTRDRALVRHVISPPAALLYATVLGTVGCIILWIWTNPLTVYIGVIGLVWYVVIYGFAKRRTPWSTLIGTVCGAVPPVAGYTAISGRVDSAALLLFLILVAWQMPHFYAIAIRRQKEYTSAGIPLLPITHGVFVTKRQMIAWIIAFTALTPLLSIAGYTGMIYLVCSLAIGLYWLMTALRTWCEADTTKWAGRLFGISLLVLLLQSSLIACGRILP